MEGGSEVGRGSVRGAPSPSAPTSVVRAGDVRGLLLLDPRDRQRKRQGVRPIGGGGGREGRNSSGAAGMLSPFAVRMGLNLLLQHMEVTYYISITRMSSFHRDTAQDGGLRRRRRLLLRPGHGPQREERNQLRRWGTVGPCSAQVSRQLVL